MQADDIKFFRSKAVTDTDANGGHMDASAEVVSGVKFNLFPRVSSAERAAGKTRFRKAFMANRADGSEAAYDAALALTVPSRGGDRFYIKAASAADTQADLTDSGWTGGGSLYSDVSAGDTEIQVLFESDDYEVPDGSLVLVKSDSGAMFSARTADGGESCVSWSGNVATVRLAAQVPDNYSAEDTYAGICIELGNLEIAVTDITVTSSSGVFDEESVSVSNAGMTDDTWTFTFTSPTAFTVAASAAGTLASGSVASTYGVMNSSGGDFYFLIYSSAWQGTWQSGDTLTFKTVSSAKGFWMKEIVPAGTERETDNMVRLDWITD
jgi:hypothetical protein